ncbi:thiW protein [Enterococcus sp. DIV2402]|jgi:energy coupling factor transporter S component ThiW|uniref:ThiW protein n=2 Tax=Candidatus Enterococcus lowellii TaxID=2230877 RepID=A0ABZ2SJ47_9ENTE|nr:energy coupling factor transporter S component ThiW [Enterococcus sp. DIV2402]MBO0465221.1 energy coupling factor transporter S component ThiW [Enterococcus sp. DIV2402]
MGNQKLQKLTYLAMMIALDVVLSPLFRIEGMAPMSSVMNVLAGVLLGPLYGTIMAFVCGVIRITLLGIPPLALTGAVFGAFFAGLGYRLYPSVVSSMVGEIIGTGIIGSLLSYPVMVWFTGSSSDFYWLMYTPRFIGAACIGSVIAFLIWQKAKTIAVIQKIQRLYKGVSI